MLSFVFCFLLQSQPLFSGNNPSYRLAQVLTLALTIKPSNITLDSKDSINKYLQENWLRKPEAERNTLTAPASLTLCTLNKFQKAFHALEMIGFQKSSKNHIPSVIVILGCNYPDMKERVLFAKSYVNKLKKKPQVILLTGDRTLEKTRNDNIPALDKDTPKNCLTEEDAGTHLINTNPDLSMILLKSTKQSKTKRATTADNGKTLEKWLDTKKIKGHIILISTEPYGPYQLATIQKNCRMENISFSVLSVPLKKKFNGKTVSVCMDTLARMVYTEINS